MRAKTGRYIICPICKKEFYIYLSTMKTYCSKKCFVKSQVGRPTWNKHIKGAGYKWKGIIIQNNCKCEICGKEFHVRPFDKKRGRGRFCSKKCFSEYRRLDWSKKEKNPMYSGIDFKLEKNPNWRGGTSFKPYPLGWGRTFKEQIRFRDGYKCVVCNMPEVENSERLCVHHIDYNKENINIDNLVSLCKKCHAKTNGNREHWLKLFLRGLQCV